MIIYLVGFMGAGKSTVGRKLASVLNYKFLDIDEYIEMSEGMTISKIFSEKGEDYFRKLESEKLKEISSRDNLVVATGGGLGAKIENMEFMKSRGVVIWLDVDIDTVFKRCVDDGTRPLLSKGRAFVTELYEKRKPVYQLADIHIDTNDQQLESILQQIIEKLI